MKTLYDKSSLKVSKLITQTYSTSFSIATYMLGAKVRPKIYAIYGFVRLADEIVDSFLEYDQEKLLDRFIDEYNYAIEEGITINPVINSFQQVVRDFQLQSLVEKFFDSMKMDLHKSEYHSKSEYERYILGSADVVGLMCLKVFCQGDEQLFMEQKQHAMKLGSAFQKVNFLRDMGEDYKVLGRVYFPNLSPDKFDEIDKMEIINNIRSDFSDALLGIKQLPVNSRFGVYIAYKYYLVLLRKLEKKSAKQLSEHRIRVSDWYKVWLLCKAYIRYQINIL